MTRQTSPLTHRGSIGPAQAFQQAAAFHAQGRLWDAEQLYEFVLKSDDRHFDSIYRLGLIRLQQSRFADAVALFRRALKVDRDSADVHLHLGVALTGLGRFEDAVLRYQQALAVRPDLAEAHNNLGYTLQLLGRHEQAARHYENALAINPGYAEARNNLGNALQALGRSEAAIAQYERALAIRPNYAEAYHNLGNVTAALGHHDEAIGYYEKALAFKPRYAEAHLSLGKALRTLGRYEEALAQFDKSLAIRPDDVEALTARGNALARLGRNAEAAELLEGLVKRGVHTINVLLALASMPASLVRIDLLAQLDKVVRNEGDDKAEFENFAAFVRAAACDKRGRHAEAWEHFVRANQTVFIATKQELADGVARQCASLARLREVPAKPVGDSGDGRQAISLFILGPSRSGKTAMETLVSILEGVKRGYENPAVKDALSRTFHATSLPTDSFFENLPPTLYSLCRNLYIDELAQRAGSARVFTSTNPGRIHDADLVAAAFPNVRFIFLKRNLEDNLLRIYQRRYNRRNNAYSYDLKAARDYVLWYHQMMDLLAKMLPNIARVIPYEDMVADPAAALRVAAELCGLPMSTGPLPAIGDDRACAAPYRRFMAAELEC